MVTFDSIRDSFDNEVDKQKLEGVKAIFVSGSVVRGTFYGDWSDVDVVVIGEDRLADGPMQVLSIWKTNLMERLGCKVGLDYVPATKLDAIVAAGLGSKVLVANGLSFLKNFHESNFSTLEKGLLYVQAGYKPPSVPKESFIGAELTDYKDFGREHVYETWLRSGQTDKDELVKLRVTVKNAIYLVQTYHLCKTGELVTDYVDMIEQASKSYDFDIDILQQVYAQRKNFGGVAPNKVRQQAKAALACFNNLFSAL